MRKAFTILAALVLGFSVSFAQVDGPKRTPMQKENTSMQKANSAVQKIALPAQKTQIQKMDDATANMENSVFQTSSVTKYLKNTHRPVQHYRIAGNPFWGQTMSYCLDGEYANSIGTNATGDTVYWGIKIESAALVGRNNITDVMFYVHGAGNYTLNIYANSPSGTAIATQNITATADDEGAWKTVHFTAPVAITQGQDLWVIFSNTDVTYPAAGVAGTQYDNGKYISLDGVDFDLITNLSSTLNYTWMIKVVSDTYAEVAPVLTLDGPTLVLSGDTVTYTISSPNATSYNWNITADYTTNNGTTAQAMWLTSGTKQVSASATNSVGTTNETLNVEVITCDPVTTFPFANGFESGIPCWTMVSMDPANDNRFGIMEDDYAYEGTHDFQFSSFSSATDYNQYLITPELSLPTTGTYVVKFYYQGYNSNDAFRVLASSTNTNIASFTVLADYPTVPTEDWAEATIVLPAGTKYVAINYYAVYQYYLYVDNFSIEELATVPTVTLVGPAEAPTNTEVTFTANSPLASTFAWTVDGTAVNESSNVLTHTFTTVGNHTVVVTASNNIGSATDTLTIETFDCEVIATFPFTNGFETGNVRCWTMISNSNANDDRFGVYQDSLAFAGDYDFRFSSYHSATDYNQYLITPELQLPATGNYMVKFKYKAHNSGDQFKVMASTTTNDLASFVVLDNFEQVATTWTDAIVALPAGTKYVAINYYGNFAYYLYVDNFSIELLNVVPTVTVAGPTSVAAGNEATFTATSPLANSFAWTVDGTAVSSTTNTMTYTFTTAGSHTVAVTATNSVGSATASMNVDVITCDAITTFPYSDNFENEATLDCWTFVDADGDTYFWDPTFCRDQVNSSTGVGYGHNGSYGMVASASYINGLGALTPDNWLISPEIVLPSTGSYVFSWFAKGQDASYCAEHYAVYVSTSGATPNDFTTALYEGETTGDWAQNIINLSAYAGQTIRIAFRHYNVTDMFWLDIDDISIELLSAPTVTISGPDMVGTGTAATFTAVAPLANSFAWTVDGTAVNESSNILTHTFTTAGNHTVAVTATNSEGSSTASMTVSVFSCDPITTFPYVQDFEQTDVYDCWTFVDYDGDGLTWDPDYLRDWVDDDGAPDPQGHNGSNGLAGSASWSSTYGALEPDNWMITPALAIPANGTYRLSWYAKGQDASYPEEYYSVYVATSNNVNALMATTPLYSGLSTDEWELKTVNLAPYAGQTIYIAFRHYNVTDMFYLDIDDISVALGTGLDDHDMNISVYPNPATNNIVVMGEGIQQVQILDMNGRTLMTFSDGGQINIAGLASGMYLVRTVTDNGVQMDKIIKK